MEEKPFFINEDGFEWFKHHRTQSFIDSMNDFNLPPLKGYTSCVVINKSKGISDFVLLHDNEPVDHYKFPQEEHEYIVKIKMIKISKHYEEQS